MRIAVIDDGVDGSVFEGVTVCEDYVVSEQGQLRQRQVVEKVITNHGTTCAGIIAKYAPDAEFISISIFQHNQLHTQPSKLIAALEWCRRKRTPLIHMSIGSTFLVDYWRLKPIVADMIENNQIIVAAYHNDGRRSCPACLERVFGVVSDKEMVCDMFEIKYDSHGQTVFYASSAHHLFFTNGESCETPIANSYAAATITARAYQILKNEPPLSITPTQLFYLMNKSRKKMRFQKPDSFVEAHYLNLCQQEVLRTHLVIKSVESMPFTSIEQLGKIENIRNIVVLPDEKGYTRKQVKDLLAPIMEKGLRAVLWGGDIHDSEDEMHLSDAAVYIWDESLLSRHSIDHLHSMDRVDCPVVKFVGSRIDGLGVLCVLKQLFIDHDVECLCISDYAFSYLYDVEFCSRTPRTNVGDYIKRMYSIYNPDLILCLFEQDVSFDVDRDNVLCFRFDNDAFFPRLACQNDSIPFENEQSDCFEYAQLLYERIVKHFGYS